jgi:hypothetical protein
VGLLSRGILGGAFPGIAGAFAIEAVLFVLTVSGVRHILRGDAQTPDFWATFLLASMPALLLFYACVAYGASISEGTPFSESLSEHLLNGATIRGFIAPLLWALYWMKSNRVRLTYGRNAFASRIAESESGVV